MQRVFKYPLDPDIDEIFLPTGAKILCVQVQQDEPYLWALVDDDVPNAIFRFKIVGTGHPFPDADDFQYVSTFQLYNGGLVFHVFQHVYPKYDQP